MHLDRFGICDMKIHFAIVLSDGVNLLEVHFIVLVHLESPVRIDNAIEANITEMIFIML